MSIIQFPMIQHWCKLRNHRAKDLKNSTRESLLSQPFDSSATRTALSRLQSLETSKGSHFHLKRSNTTSGVTQGRFPIEDKKPIGMRSISRRSSKFCTTTAKIVQFRIQVFEKTGLLLLGLGGFLCGSYVFLCSPSF